MSAPFGPKSATAAEAGDLLLITRGTGAALEVEKLDPTAAATAALIALGIDAHLGSDAWRTGAGGGGSNVILWGTGAPTGDDGTDDDFWIDITAWTIHGPKAAGSWPSGVALIGPAGADGDAGADGADGAAFLSGAGAPAGGTGADGDAWFDTTGRTLYGPKAAGAWGSGTSLLGAPGSDGADGEDGRDPELRATATHLEWRLDGDVDWTELVALAGITGPPGADGNDGDDGADGADGAALQGVTTQPGTSYTFVLGDAERMVEFTGSAAVTVTVPPNASVAFPIGTVLHVAQDAAGPVSIAAGAGVTLKKHAAYNAALAGQHAIASLAKVGTDTWRLFGHLETAS